MLNTEVVCKPAFLDSGAHTKETGVWTELPIDAFIEFVNEYHHHFCMIAVPDEIGDSKETEENVHYFMKRLSPEVPVEKVVGIYHIQCRSMKQLNRCIDYCKEYKLNKFALGGALGGQFNEHQKMLVLQQCFQRIPRDLFWVHLLGVHAPQMVKLFRPDSVDSATFIQKAKHLEAVKYNLPTWGKVQGELMPKGVTRPQLMKYMMKHLESHLLRLDNILPIVKDRDEVYRQIERIPDAAKFLLLNGLRLLEYEEKVRDELLPHFRHFITCPTNYLLNYSEIPRELLRHVWRERPLTSYSQFHEKNTATLKKELALFGEID